MALVLEVTLALLRGWQDDEVFWMLTGETPETLKPGRRVDAIALRVFANEVICQVIFAPRTMRCWSRGSFCMCGSVSSA